MTVEGARQDVQVSVGKDLVIISTSAEFNTVVLNGTIIERAGDGHLVISAAGTVLSKPGPANDFVAKAAPQIGDVMPAGDPNAGWIFMGPDENTGKDFYAAPEDESGTFTFNQVAQQAQKIGAQVPTKSQLDKMYKNKDKGALKGTFNETGSYSAGWYWSSSRYFIDYSAWAQRFSDGSQDDGSRHFTSSLRLVR